MLRQWYGGSPSEVIAMKSNILVWFLALYTLPVAWSQESDTKQEGSNPPPSQQEPSAKPAPKRPTLGPAPAPTLMGPGPRTSSTNDPHKLIRVKKVYVERMENGLNEKLIAAITKLNRFQVVNDLTEADAVLRGTCLDSRRLKTVRSEVYLNQIKGASIWQDNVRRPYNPPTVDVAVTESAEIIAAHLSESLVEAERH